MDLDKAITKCHVGASYAESDTRKDAKYDKTYLADKFLITIR